MQFKKVVLVFSFVMLFSVMAHAIQVSFYMGDVKIIRQGKAVRITTGIQLQSGDIIKTGSNGMVEIVYSDNSKVIVREKSTVRIGSPSLKKSENPALILGSVTGKSQKIAHGSHKIYGTSAVCAVRGTEFDVAVAENGDSRVEVKEGVVEVSNPDGEVSLQKGERAEAVVSEKPEKDSKQELAQWLEEKEGELEKSPSDNAKRYDEYVQSLGKENDGTKNDIKSAGKMVASAKNSNDLNRAGRAIDAAEENLEDNIILTETAASALEIIISDCKKRRDTVYREFERIKKEADRVNEVQQKSHAQIQALKDDFNKAVDRIMGAYGEKSKKILDDVNFDRARPEIEKYELK